MLTNQIFIFGLFWSVNANLWVCKNNKDCLRMDANAECINSQCQCPPMKVYSYEKMMCINSILYGDKCDESIQCNLMFSRAFCSDGICKCQNNEIYVQGQCKVLKLLDEDCLEDIDCYFGYDRQSVYCNSKKKCACAPEYYKRHTNICRKIAKNLKDPCVVHADCLGINKKVKCAANECTGEENLIRFNITNDSVLKEKKMFYGNSAKNLTTQKIGDKCDEIQKPCPGLPNSICLGYCYCKNGYNPQNLICIAEVGEKAEKREECDKKGIQFDEKLKICKCNPNYFVEENLRSCKKPVTMKVSCTSDGQCSPFNAKCTFHNGGPTRKCQCESYAEYNEELELCIDRKGLGGPCKTNDDCDIQNSLCGKDDMCTCKPNYYENKGKCSAGVGSDCLQTKDCVPENSVCIENKCQCTENFISVEKQCYKVVEKVASNCSYNEQCESIKAICQNSTCVCREDFHISYNKCFLTKELGDICKSVGECFVTSGEEYVECKNSICRCKIGSFKETHPEKGKICVNSSVKNKLSKLSIIVILIFFFTTLFY